MQNIYLLHGLLGTCYVHFSAQMQAWRGDYRVIPIDLPGHGRSHKNAERPYYHQAIEHLKNLLTQIGPGHVIGASYLGGSIALLGALSYPELFRSLVLTGYVSEVPQDVINQWTRAFFLLAERNSAFAQHYTSVHGSRWQNTLEIITEEIHQEYKTMIAVPCSTIQTLMVPTLIANGSIKSDECEGAIQLPLHNPRIQAGLIPGAGHIACQDQPEMFNLMVENFWKRVEDQTYAS